MSRDNPTQRQVLKLAAAVAGFMGAMAAAKGHVALERPLYESTHGPDSYAALVTDKIRFLVDESGLNTSSLRSQANEMTQAHSEGAFLVQIDAAKFVIFEQATREELEFAAATLGINDLDGFLQIWDTRDLDGPLAGLELAQ